MTSNHAGRRPVRRRVLASLAAAMACGLGLAAPAARAQAQVDYAVLSLVGDQIGIVGYNPSVGSNLSKQGRRQIDLQDDSLDRVVLLAVYETIKEQEANAEIDLLKSRNPAHFDFEAHDFGSLRDRGGLLDSLKPLVQQTHAKRLVLVTKHRADAMLAVMDGGLSRPGKLYGPGFYVDRVTAMQRRDTGETSVGFVSPFAYLRVSVIDVATMAIVSTATATESITVSTAHKREAVHPWDALDAGEKVQYVQQATRVSVVQALGRQKPVN